MLSEIVSAELSDAEEIVLMRIAAADKQTIGKTTVFRKQQEAVLALKRMGFIQIHNPERNKLISMADYFLTDAGRKFLNERETKRQAKKL